MIEKLEEKNIYDNIDGEIVIVGKRRIATPEEMQDKINEIIDYINSKEV